MLFFSSCSNIQQKRLIIPNLIESLPPDESLSADQQLTEGNELLGEMYRRSGTEPASLPLVNIQNELEVKINNVLCELENLRRKDEILSGQLIEKSLRQSVENTEEKRRRDDENLLRDEQTRSRINYLENLQEKQVSQFSKDFQ